MPASITKGTNVLAYLYDGDHRRVREERTGANAGRTIHVLHGDAAFFEQETTASGTQKYRHFISTPEGVAEVVEKTASTTSVKVMHRDHLGSTVAITDEASTDLMGFDAWGQRRSAADAGAPQATFKTTRGSTGHEHLDEVGLVHMNGRLYDPMLGRFFSADPIVQAPYNLQSYNRYSYVLNNPLSLTDPSGFSWWTKFRDRIAKPIVIAVAMWWTAGAFSSAMIADASSSAFAADLAAGANAFEAYGAASAAASAAAPGAYMAGGAAAGFAAGGLQGGNIESAFVGALSGGVGNFLAGGAVFPGPIERIGSSANPFAPGGFTDFGQNAL